MLDRARLVAIGLLAVVSLTGLAGCRDTTAFASLAGTYAGEINNKDVQLLLSPDGKGEWSVDYETVACTWEPIEGGLLLRTKDGGVILAQADAGVLRLRLPVAGAKAGLLELRQQDE